MRGDDEVRDGDAGVERSARAEEELLCCGLERGKEEDLVVAGWLDWMEEEMDGSVVAGLDRARSRGRRSLVLAHWLAWWRDRGEAGRVVAVKRISMDWTG